MNRTNTIILILIFAIIVGAYFVITKNKTTNLTAESEIVYCDEAGNRYNTEADAKAAGLSEAEYRATYCPEYVAAKTGDYTGVPVTQAEEIAKARGEQFRVVERDGEMQPTTRDFQEGRINATVEAGVVTSYTVESSNPPAEESEMSQSGVHDEIIGMTTTAAEAYAKTNEIDFRTGTVDGVSLPVTADFRPGRITADIENGVVVKYTVE